MNKMSGPWWGNMNLPKQRSLRLELGALSLAIEHREFEWCVHYQREPEISSNDNRFLKEIGQFSPCYFKDVARYIVSHKTDTVEIMPALADRTVVCRPMSAINLVPGASVVLYVSTPIWLTISLQNAKTTLLQELAVQRLSDTWFGSSTRHGELCYASMTTGRMDLAALPYRIQRATTPLIIHNKADNNLLFERVALPAPLLSLYSTKSGRLWTEAVTLTREDDGDMAQLDIGKPQADTVLVNGPRQTSERGKFIRAFSAIFK
jgi:hypothetical protein